MTPKEHFEAVWSRCAEISILHTFLANNVTGVLDPSELLRAEWVMRLSALDLYVHELVAQRMRESFEGRRPPSPAYLRFTISTETLDRIRAATTASDAGAAFDLEVREQLSYLTFQDPDKIADGIRLCSEIELWNDVALQCGATPSSRIPEAKRLKRELSLLVQRRNRIAHEGDLQPTPIRDPWPIAAGDVRVVTGTIERIVYAIDSIV